ncbi:unnamed protein product [Candida verbasci]|uniref:Prefoldin subunit 4 n=1 Tax=Candida verbasci TaxID=1227364 RepID=A0A9W4TY28_9ASCO|nr:unnamed protein product [Candida verbasci]
MELLPEGQRNTATEVKWEDQQKINKFSTIISKKDELLIHLDQLNQEKEYSDDLSLEIELLDEDDTIQYKLGDSFVFMKVSKAISKLESDQEKMNNKIDASNELIVKYDEELNELKSHLYAKFGNNINLER